MDVIESMESSTIRVDNTTKKGSAIDTVRMVLGNNSSAANTTLSRLLLENEGVGTRCTHAGINNKGKETPVADAKTLIEIIWLLPGKKAREFRHKSSEKVCRLLGGDMSLVSEIEARHATLQSTEQGRATQQFLLGDEKEEEAVEIFDGMPPGFRFLATHERQDVAKQMVDQHLKRKRADDMVQTYLSLKDLGVHLDQRTLIEIRDNVGILARQDFTTATPLIQDSTTPTHELDAEQRGPETGIVPVSCKIGVRVPNSKSGIGGKRMKVLYKKKYSLPPDWNAFIKRQTLFSGRPILENVYYRRDEDIIERAICDVMEM